MGPHGADDLRQDFGHLTRRYRVVSLETLFLNLRDQDPMESVCTIGFDDGYRDNIDHALPLLKKYGCPASFYVVTDCIDNKWPTWTYQVDYLLRNTRANSVRVESVNLPNGLREAGLESELAKLDYARRFKPHLKMLVNTDRLSVLEELRQRLDDVDIPRNMMMSWNDVQSLHASGFTVGSHRRRTACLRR